MTNTTVTVNVHNTSTEILIIVSQTVFFILLFLMLKHGLVDRRGMLSSKERINEDMFQIMAIFFAIFVIIGIFMIPIESYEYAHFILPITFCLMFLITGYEVYTVLNNNETKSTGAGVKRVRFSDIESQGSSDQAKAGSSDTSRKSTTSSSSKFWSGPSKSATSFFSSGTNSGTTKRPVNF